MTAQRLDDKTRAQIVTVLMDRGFDPQALRGMLLRSIETHIEALGGIAAVASDADYLRSQNPADLALLYRTLSDHTARALDMTARLRKEQEREGCSKEAEGRPFAASEDERD